MKHLFGGQVMWRLRILVIMALFAFGVQAFAQGGGSAAITGTVTDPTGALITGADVKVTQKNTSVSRTDVSNASGAFNVPSLPPATYTVTIEAKGFQRYVQDVVLLADQVRNLDVRMTIG